MSGVSGFLLVQNTFPSGCGGLGGVLGGVVKITLKFSQVAPKSVLKILRHNIVLVIDRSNITDDGRTNMNDKRRRFLLHHLTEASRELKQLDDTEREIKVTRDDLRFDSRNEYLHTKLSRLEIDRDEQTTCFDHLMYVINSVDLSGLKD